MKYRVKRGDTLGSVARQFLGDSRRAAWLVAANPLIFESSALRGAELVIPDISAMADDAVRDLEVAASPASGVSEQRLAKVHPILAARVRAMMELLAQGGTEIMITQGLRTWEEQDALYAKGRTAPPIGKKYIVTKAKGGQSYHNFGLAVDIVVLDALRKADWDVKHPGWAAAGTAGQSVGLEWGGAWKGFKDIPHFQYTGGLELEECRALYGVGGIPAVWARVA
jgi:D-alanyl-D-alanine dipeptidase